MARIRYLKPDFFKDEDLAEIPYDIRLFFAGLWCYADKAGRLEDRPLRLKADIMPYDLKFEVERALEILAHPKKHSPIKKPFIIRYEINGERYIQIVSWGKHQKPHHTETESSIPPPVPPKNKEKENYKGNGECSYSECSDHEPIKNGQITVKEPIIKLILDEEPKRWEGITEELKELWAKSYPGCDVEFVLQEMIAYWDAQPKSKRKINWKRTIVNRLKWVQDHGGTKKGRQSLEEWAAEEDAKERQRK